MTFADAVRRCLTTGYANFNGRAGRPEFWWFALFGFGANLAVQLIDAILFGSDGIGLFEGLFTLAILVPSLAVGARRLHDIDRSGWWQAILLVPLIGILVMIYFWAQRGIEGPNRFGPRVRAAVRRDRTVPESSVPKVRR
ncbi:DUF805 domain-containing protein [Jannaschia sp. M317]|uniref:DUF805 domain-containing protein n=1 Tax=Jannaschia sp. M317 TaxID=2867011 RepID=UPI0021A34F0B|nr:DUF805 domain-containing protein [Jannaschia sp. M317]UWQ19156.1 DUF805 domain-containing protein [Jannaschia sp. M317]